MSLSAYKYLDKVRQEVLIELCFAMNAKKVSKFVNMLAALQVKDYIEAGKELLDSDWARTVGSNRANDLAHRLVYGRYS
jgi:lysozyme